MTYEKLNVNDFAQFIELEQKYNNSIGELKLADSQICPKFGCFSQSSHSVTYSFKSAT